jgi:hypothetical protein
MPGVWYDLFLEAVPGLMNFTKVLLALYLASLP